MRLPVSLLLAATLLMPALGTADTIVYVTRHGEKADENRGSEHQPDLPGVEPLGLEPDGEERHLDAGRHQQGRIEDTQTGAESGRSGKI